MEPGHGNENVRMHLSGSSSSSEDSSPEGSAPKRARTIVATPGTKNIEARGHFDNFLTPQATATGSSIAASSTSNEGTSGHNIGVTLPPFDGATKQYYVAKEGKIKRKILYIICLGLKDDDGAKLLDLDDPNLAPYKKNLKVTCADLSDEVMRRSNLGVLKERERTPCPSNWKYAELSEWLSEHQIVGEEDISYFRREGKKLKYLAKRAAEEKAQQASQGGAWQGRAPYLRLLMGLVEDDIKPVYLCRADAMTRQQLDGRNSEVLQKNIFDLLADKWNDSNFNPFTPQSACHKDFSSEIDCGFETVKNNQKAEGKKVKDILTHWRAELTMVITKWEASGNGDGGIRLGPDENIPEGFGHLDNRTRKALDARESFLGGKPTYLLLVWELMDQHQLLSSSLQQLTEDCMAADASEVPDVLGLDHPNDNKTPRKNLSQTDPGLLKLAQSIDNFAKAEASAGHQRELPVRKNELEDQKRSYMEKQIIATNPELKQFYEKQVNEITQQLKEINDELET